jgi:hypothetical protein
MNNTDTHSISLQEQNEILKEFDENEFNNEYDEFNEEDEEFDDDEFDDPFADFYEQLQYIENHQEITTKVHEIINENVLKYLIVDNKSPIIFINNRTFEPLFIDENYLEEQNKLLKKNGYNKKPVKFIHNAGIITSEIHCIDMTKKYNLHWHIWTKQNKLIKNEDQEIYDALAFYYKCILRNCITALQITVETIELRK